MAEDDILVSVCAMYVPVSTRICDHKVRNTEMKACSFESRSVVKDSLSVRFLLKHVTGRSSSCCVPLTQTFTRSDGIFV